MIQIMGSLVAKAVGDCAKLVVDARAYRATKYISDQMVVKVTRRHKIDRRNSRDEFVVTYGKPNYEETHFIKKCKRAGEPLPVRKILLKYPPKK